MIASPDEGPVGVLVSGGLDSAVLVSHLLRQGSTVQPISIRSRHRWEEAERATLREYLASEARPTLRPLVGNEQPDARNTR